MNANTVILCSTARLARSLRLAHGRSQRAQGMGQWQPLHALTLSQWLAATVEQAMLQGELALDSMPRLVLSASQELVLWERVIERMLSGDAAAALFDRGGLARAAMEANRLLQEWNIALPERELFGLAEEVEQFLVWRTEFRRTCKAAGWLEGTRYMDWQISQLQQGAGTLPARVELAGYDRVSPQEQRLLDTLQARGVTVARRQHLQHVDAPAAQTGLADAEAECRAAVAWAAQRLRRDPQSRLAIVVPELASLRERLSALLDDNLHASYLSPVLAESVRSYDLSLGSALARVPIVHAALDLLRACSQRRHVAQPELSRLLLSPYWSAGSSEADARAQLDARMRAHLPLNLSLQRLQRFAVKHQQRGLSLARLLVHLQAMLDALAGLPARQAPSAWADTLAVLLDLAGWPGQRSPSSHEFQAKQAFERVLAGLADFDALSGPVSLAQAVQRLAQLCNDQVFQPESQDDPQLLVMGMLESVASPLDAMWVMGMNDHIWPAPARPNPLLPASLQRAARAPNADGPVQAEFARAIHARLLRSAAELTFSWSHKSGESELRVSPMLQGMATLADIPELAVSLAEQLSQADQHSPRQWLDDHVAPAITSGARISGGAGLLKAQAICPAWAYFRYRLGARALEQSVDSLDAMGRGTLVHAVLQSFWQDRDSEYLHGLTGDALAAAIEAAVEQGVARFSARQEETMPEAFLGLEKQRLRLLLTAWLAYERTREPFEVEQCEQQIQLDIHGMLIDLTLDRVDRLPDGRRIVIDYKTGSNVSLNSWADARISEPQLPIYTALALAGHDIAGVSFAQVRAEVQRFVGISAETGVLPDVRALQDSSKTFPPELFADWSALLARWRLSIETVAAEVAAGEAAVRYRDERELVNCDVLPLLRLPERALQIERMEAAGTARASTLADTSRAKDVTDQLPGEAS